MHPRIGHDLNVYSFHWVELSPNHPSRRCICQQRFAQDKKHIISMQNKQLFDSVFKLNEQQLRRRIYQIIVIAKTKTERKHFLAAKYVKYTRRLFQVIDLYFYILLSSNDTCSLNVKYKNFIILIQVTI